MVSITQKSFLLLIVLVGVLLCTLAFLKLPKTITEFSEEIQPESTNYFVVAKMIRRQLMERIKLPTIYLITATYTRPEQLPDLTRLSYTLMHVPNILWLVIEDAKAQSPIVADILRRSDFPYIHLIAPAPPEAILKNKIKARGVSNRNRGLQWLKENYADPDGVIYFADDDNTYDLRLFDEIRSVKKIGIWPVGLVAGKGVSSPIVEEGVVTGFYDGWLGNRTFPVDMAGFAFSVALLLEHPNASMPFLPGYEEDRFIKKLGVQLEDIEPKADNCTKIYVWHTQTKKNRVAVRPNATYDVSNIKILYDNLLGSSTE